MAGKQVYFTKAELESIRDAINDEIIVAKVNLALALLVKEAHADKWTDEDTPHGEMSSSYSPFAWQSG